MVPLLKMQVNTLQGQGQLGPVPHFKVLDEHAVHTLLLCHRHFLPLLINHRLVGEQLVLQHPLDRRHLRFDVGRVINDADKERWNGETIRHDDTTIARNVHVQCRCDYGRKASEECHKGPNDRKSELEPFIDSKCIPLYLDVLMTRTPELLNKLVLNVVCTDGS